MRTIYDARMRFNSFHNFPEKFSTRTRTLRHRICANHITTIYVTLLDIWQIHIVCRLKERKKSMLHIHTVEVRRNIWYWSSAQLEGKVLGKLTYMGKQCASLWIRLHYFSKLLWKTNSINLVFWYRAKQQQRTSSVWLVTCALKVGFFMSLTVWNRVIFINIKSSWFSFNFFSTQFRDAIYFLFVSLLELYFYFLPQIFATVIIITGQDVLSTGNKWWW